MHSTFVCEVEQPSSSKLFCTPYVQYVSGILYEFGRTIFQRRLPLPQLIARLSHFSPCRIQIEQWCRVLILYCQLHGQAGALVPKAVDSLGDTVEASACRSAWDVVQVHSISRWSTCTCMHACSWVTGHAWNMACHVMACHAFIQHAWEHELHETYHSCSSCLKVETWRIPERAVLVLRRQGEWFALTVHVNASIFGLAGKALNPTDFIAVVWFQALYSVLVVVVVMWQPRHAEEVQSQKHDTHQPRWEKLPKHVPL